MLALQFQIRICTLLLLCRCVLSDSRLPRQNVFFLQLNSNRNKTKTNKNKYNSLKAHVYHIFNVDYLNTSRVLNLFCAYRARNIVFRIVHLFPFSFPAADRLDEFLSLVLCDRCDRSFRLALLSRSKWVKANDHTNRLNDRTHTIIRHELFASKTEWAIDL